MPMDPDGHEWQMGGQADGGTSGQTGCKHGRRDRRGQDGRKNGPNMRVVTEFFDWVVSGTMGAPLLLF